MARAAVKKAFGPAQHALDSGYTGDMDDRRTGSGLLRRGWLRLVDGDRAVGIDRHPA